MSDITDAIFGGGAKDAAGMQVEATERAMQEYKKGIQEAKDEINPAFNRASEMRLNRSQQSLNALQAGFQPSLDVMQQGNVNAQQTIAGSAPQMANAILGNPIDYGFMQPQGIDFDVGSFLGSMPQVQQEQTNLPANTPNMPIPQQPNVPSNMGDLLGGGINAGGGNSGGFNIFGAPNQRLF